VKLAEQLEVLRVDAIFPHEIVREEGNKVRFACPNDVLDADCEIGA
jgi:hypothetical protein